MDNRAFLSGASASAPAAQASPSTGFPTGGNPATATPPTNPGPFWFHAIGEELRAVIVAGGLTPAQGTLTQVRDALDARYGATGGAQQLLAVRGYQKLPGGLILQWGQETNGAAGTTAIVFPTPFLAACYVVMVTPRNLNMSSSINVSASSYTTTGFNMFADTGELPTSWFAVGS